jgi:hypothetical protein
MQLLISWRLNLTYAALLFYIKINPAAHYFVSARRTSAVYKKTIFQIYIYVHFSEVYIIPKQNLSF